MNSTYRIEFLPRAQRQLGKLERSAQVRLTLAVNALAVDPRPANAKKLQGRPGYRLRVGDFRVIYTVDDAARTVTVAEVGHRKEIYRLMLDA